MKSTTTNCTSLTTTVVVVAVLLLLQSASVTDYITTIGIVNAFIIPISTKKAKTITSTSVSFLEKSLRVRDSKNNNNNVVLSSTSSSNDSNNNYYSDDEWHPHDPAWTVPQLLSGIWSQIAQGKDMVKGETSTVIYPQMQDQLMNPKFLNLLFGHLDTCKDVCDHFGITTTLVPYKDKNNFNRITGFTVKSFRNPNVDTINKLTDDGNFDFTYDPFWDDGTDFESLYEGIDDEDIKDDPYPPIVNKIPDNDEEIIDITKQWVNTVMADMGICPFTQNADKAGLPVGNIFYNVDRSTGFEDMYAVYWQEVCRLEQNKEKEISTILLIIPEFCFDNVELFESFTNTLTQPLAPLEIENLIQLVFFHPLWSFRDGDARASIEGQAANYARRSPWPMINLLRTNQVRTAQKGIPTGLVYKQNEKTLNNVGVTKLETMLRLRDWSDTSQYKVNRKEFDALKIAQNFQQTGIISKEDTSFVNDATPAANKIDRKQVEQGNLVNVILQALEKRLGKNDDNNNIISQLNGPETSATAMATDVLIEQLDTIIIEKEQTTAPVTTTATTTTVAESTSNDNDETVDEYTKARQARMEAARKALLEDITGKDESSQYTPRGGDPMEDVLLGRSGIAEKGNKKDNDDDQMFPEGMNPQNFY